MAIKNIKFEEDDLPTLSCCMIVKNEEENLAKYLAPIASSFDEIIVVDTGSTDNTKALATQLGAKVYNFPWIGDFAAARNAGLDHATKDYIMWLDADDEMSKQDVARIKFHVKGNPGQVHLRLVDFQNGMRFDSHQLRVFPNNPKYRFSGRIHEQIAPCLEADNVPVSYADVPIIHRGYENPEVLQQKLVRNLEMLRREAIMNPKAYDIVFTLGRTALSLGLLEEGRDAIDRCIQMFENGEVEVGREHVAMTFITKAAILPPKDAIKTLEKAKALFPESVPVVASLGETYFKNKMYEKSYKTLLPFRKGECNIGLFPMDVTKLMFAIRNFLAMSSLNVGDFKTAEILFGEFINDPDFKIKR